VRSYPCIGPSPLVKLLLGHVRTSGEVLGDQLDQRAVEYDGLAKRGHHSRRFSWPNPNQEPPRHLTWAAKLNQPSGKIGGIHFIKNFAPLFAWILPVAVANHTCSAASPRLRGISQRPKIPAGSLVHRPTSLWPSGDGRAAGRYCGAAGVGAGLSELGFTDRMKAMILQRSSLVLIIPPKGGIGPVTISCFTRA
jgi:hypothetical protein